MPAPAATEAGAEAILQCVEQRTTDRGALMFVQLDHLLHLRDEVQPVGGEIIHRLFPFYEHYLDLLDDEADSQDAELTARLAQAADQPTGGERQAFRVALSLIR